MLVLFKDVVFVLCIIMTTLAAFLFSADMAKKKAKENIAEQLEAIRKANEAM